jgi:hypothetical protein
MGFRSSGKSEPVATGRAGQRSWRARRRAEDGPKEVGESPAFDSRYAIAGVVSKNVRLTKQGGHLPPKSSVVAEDRMR